MSELLEWRRHDSHSEICPTEFGPYMVEDVGGDEVWAWLPDQQQQARRRVNSGSVSGAKALCQEDVDTRRALRGCTPYLAEGETPAQRIEREFKGSQTLIGLLAVKQARIERLSDALTTCLDAVNAAGGVALGIAMSGKNHPNPDGALMEVFQSCQEASTKASAALSEGKP